MTTQYKRILVPLDGSDVADAAISVAKLIGRSYNAEICLLTVLHEQGEETGTGTLSGPDNRSPTTVNDIPERAYTYLEDVTQELRDVDLDCGFSFSVGNDTASEIVLNSRETQADLLVMATRGRSGVAIGLLSPITDRVIHSSPVPVLVVPRSLDLWNPGTLIVPLDGSDLAEEAITHAESIASKTDASIALIRVVSEPPRYGRDPYGGMPVDLPITEQDERDAESYLAGVETRLKAGGHQVDSHVVKGHPGAQITRLSRDIAGALVVISTRGSSGLTRWVLGCTADNVIRSSGVPVLIIPPQINW